MQNKLKLTIGISAYNEASNIKRLLLSLISQDSNDYELDQIIIVSDGSTDGTVDEVRSLESNNIVLLEHKVRKGKAIRQNEISIIASSDVVLIMDADVIPKDKNFLDNMVRPFYANANLGIVGANAEPLPAENFFEKVLNYSQAYKKEIYLALNKTDNLYLCPGRSIAYSKNLTSQLEFPKTISGDVYSYLYAKKLGYDFYFQDMAIVYYRTPQNLHDHLNQSVRFIQGRRVLLRYFTPATIQESYHIPTSLLLAKFFKFLFQHPVYCIFYSGILFSSFIFSFFTNKSNILWQSSRTSKTLSNNTIQND